MLTSSPPTSAPGTDKTGMDFRRILPEIHASPVCPRVRSPLPAVVFRRCPRLACRRVPAVTAHSPARGAVLRWNFQSHSEVFVSRITRKELKTDKFALEVEHGISFFEHHKSEAVKYGAIAIGAIVLIAGYTIYQRGQHNTRQAALAAAIRVQEAVSYT